jgi:16S rRNA (cytidine1402-2'-O)-methyltransferase
MMIGENRSLVYLIPAPLHENVLNTIPPYVVDAVKSCHSFFVENERSARRYLKSVYRELIIDDRQWVTIGKAEENIRHQFLQCLEKNETIGIISEAGCPGIADPGQLLVELAHRKNAIVKPLVGPSSILLALMASGLQGQHFQFNGYLPIDQQERTRAIRQLEDESLRKGCTQVFIETPYRNNQMMETLMKTLRPSSRISVAVDLTSEKEFIKTLTVAEWKKHKIDLHKRPTIFSMLAVNGK